MWDHDADFSDDHEADMCSFGEPAADDGDDMGAFK